MSFFDRISRLFRANVNSAISAAEQPEKILNQIIDDMRGHLAKAKQQVAASIADEKRLQDQVTAELREAEEWERRAMLAVREGKDDLAKQALVRRNEHVNHGQQLQMTWEAHRQETERLKHSLRELSDNIEEANRKKTLLLAKQRRAEAQRRIAETMSRVSDKSAFEAFARMEERIEQNTRRAQASVVMDQELSGDRLANEFRQLETAADDATAEMQLLQLKQKMGVLPGGPLAAKQLGVGGDRVTDAAGVPTDTTTADGAADPPSGPSTDTTDRTDAR